jgi:hypothetical protein
VSLTSDSGGFLDAHPMIISAAINEEKNTKPVLSMDLSPLI